MINNDFCVKGGTFGGNGRGTPLSARRPAPARNGPTARFEKVRKGAGRATSRKRRHGPPTSGEGVKRTVE